MFLLQPSSSVRIPALVAAAALTLGTTILLHRPAVAAYVMSGDLLGQVCRDVAVKATCDAPFKIDEVRPPTGDTPLDVGPVFPVVTDVEGNQCRFRVGPRATFDGPDELRPLLTAKFFVDHHDGLNAVPVDFLVFNCRSQ